jgi:hypothetical protein
MKFLTLLVLFASFNTFACLNLEGSLAVDGELFKFNQKCDHAKNYSFPLGNFILNMTVDPAKGKTHPVTYSVFEKKGVKLTLVTKGDDELTEGAAKEIYAKGEENQPNTIIILKLNNI